ncbi:MAG: hypothetical protein JW889_08295 [Verrucomicrobia bacterium]|nr:hypothetical protein [Verrucomicrobiota bacterium]
MPELGAVTHALVARAAFLRIAELALVIAVGEGVLFVIGRDLALRRGALRRAWAIARTTLREAVRTRTVAVMAIVLALVIVGGPFVLQGTGKLADRIQLVLTYSMTAVGFLLSVLTIFLSASTLSTDLRDKRIETIATKPIPRSQVLLGKWLAVMTLNTVLLVASALVVYGLARLVIGPLSKAKDDEERTQLVNEVYTARHMVKPLRFDAQIEEAITKEIAHLRQVNKDNPGFAQTFNETAHRAKRRKELWAGYNTLPPGAGVGYIFENVRPARPGQTLFLRYKLISVGPSEQPTGEKPRVVLAWHAVGAREWFDEDLDPVTMDDYHELRIPGDVAGADGRMIIEVVNMTSYPDMPVRNVYAAFPPDDGITLLYEAGTFEGNFLRTVLLVLVRLAFLSALALAAAALLSFPVATMFVVFVFMCTLLVNQFAAFSAPIAGSEEHPFYEIGSPAYRVVFKALSVAIPNLGRYDGSTGLATGRLVSWDLLLKGLARIAIIYGGIVMLLGCLYFRARELEQAE